MVCTHSKRYNTSGSVPDAVVKYAVAHLIRRQHDDQAGTSTAPAIECVTMPEFDPADYPCQDVVKMTGAKIYIVDFRKANVTERQACGVCPKCAAQNDLKNIPMTVWQKDGFDVWPTLQRSQLGIDIILEAGK